MLAVALVGPSGSGKTTLAYTFSHYLSKRDVPATWANLDVFCKRLTYPTVYDVREHYPWRKIAKTDEKPDATALRVYHALATDARYRAIRNAQAASKRAFLLDCYGGADFYLLAGGAKVLSHLADVAVFLADERTSAETAASIARQLAREAGIPVVAALNKADVLSSKSRAKAKTPRALSAFDENPSSRANAHGVVHVSAVNADGFAELWRSVSTARV